MSNVVFSLKSVKDRQGNILNPTITTTPASYPPKILFKKGSSSSDLITATIESRVLNFFQGATIVDIDNSDIISKGNFSVTLEYDGAEVAIDEHILDNDESYDCTVTLRPPASASGKKLRHSALPMACLQPSRSFE